MAYNVSLVYINVLLLLFVVKPEALNLEKLDSKLVFSAFVSVVVPVHFLRFCVTCLDTTLSYITLVSH